MLLDIPGRCLLSADVDDTAFGIGGRHPFPCFDDIVGPHRHAVKAVPDNRIFGQAFAQCVSVAMVCIEPKKRSRMLSSVILFLLPLLVNLPPPAIATAAQ